MKIQSTHKLYLVIIVFVCIFLLIGCSSDKIPEQTPDTVLLQYHELTLNLPGNYIYQYNDDGSLYLIRDDIPVGGIQAYAVPDTPLRCSIEWLRAIGLPEAQAHPEQPIAYTIESSSYGVLQAEFYHELDPNILNTQHYFFLCSETVYDIYYDQNRITDEEANVFLRTIQINGESVQPR